MLVPKDGMQINANTTLQPGVYLLPAGMSITADHITLDDNGTVLIGNNQQGIGLAIHNHKHVTIRNLTVLQYYYGIQAINCQALTIQACRASSSAEVPANSDFLNVWLPASESYGGGIILQNVADGLLADNDLRHQMNGVHLYSCQGLRLERNNASYCSGWGFHLYETCDCVFIDNWAEYCCRYHPRGLRQGHLGADAAGFLIVASSSRNIFRRNQARMSGDGFFLAGRNPLFSSVPCSNNLFEDNDASHSPNIGFEATFSSDNIFRINQASACNYGFWLGFSTRNLLESNQILANHQAGIAVENGVDFTVRKNTFNHNSHAILLWSKRLPDCETNAPGNDTSRNWLIEQNTFSSNTKAIRIAANQDHGIRPLREDGIWGLPAPAPLLHTIRATRFENNGQDFDMHGIIDTTISENSTTNDRPE